MTQLHERFLAAVRACIGPEPVKQRLTSAWLEQLDAIEVSELPETLQPRFSKLRGAMYAQPALPGEQAPAAAIRKMSAHQAAQHTAAIHELANDLVALFYRNQNTAEDDDQKLLFGRDLGVPERLN